MGNDPRRKGWRLGGTFVAAATTAALIFAIGQLLTLPSGYGVEDLLGWTGDDQVRQMLYGWGRQLHGLEPWVAGLYLGLDIAVFMPLYGLVFVGLWCQARSDFAEHSAKDGEWCAWLVRTGSALVVALWFVDLVENVAGLQRTELSWVGPLALAGGAVVVVVLRRFCDGDWLLSVLRMASPLGSWRRWGWWLTVLVTASGLAWLFAKTQSDCTSQTRWIWYVGCLAHGMKTPLFALLALGPLLLTVWVQYGPHADTNRWERVAAVRLALVQVFWRTRYVLTALAACAALMLVMNQGRDVVYAMASHPWRQEENKHWLWFGTVLALGLTALSLWILCHSCWLWSRLAMRVAHRKDGAREGKQLTEDHLAKFWARLLGAAPSLLVLGMVLAVLPEAVVLPVHEPIIVLLAFACMVVVLSVGFIWKRDRLSRGQNELRPYFASHSLEDAIKEGTKSRLFGCVTPVVLPAFALAVALACRALALWGTEPLSLPTLTLPIMFCLVAFWLGVAGWISLYEESESVPWFLFLLVVIGLLGTFGLAGNHQVPVIPGGATLDPQKAMLVTLALGAVLMASSVLMVWLLASSNATVWNMLACALLLFGGSWAVVVKLSSHVFPPAVAPTAGLPIEAIDARNAFMRWLKELCPNEGGGVCAGSAPVPVYLVVAEGGGIRSAYWTALVLQRLHEDPGRVDFDRRVFAMTGVSGGALGIAVYRACRIRASSESDGAHASKVLADCIDTFGRSDLLAPLVGAWFFEDAVASLLPAKCDQPGCAILSRGLWFEGAMRKAVPELAMGLAASRESLAKTTGGHQPYILLNSTWVETGERTIASELTIDWNDFPGARDQLAMLGQADLPLLTAAHNSARFPFTNAIGAVHSPKGRCDPSAYGARHEPVKTETELCGHLADGGYFDNSGGGHTATDLLRLLQGCLSGKEVGGKPPCPNLPADTRTRLAKQLSPRVILIRNGVKQDPLPVEACPSRGMPKPERVLGAPQAQIPTGLRQPRCANGGRLFMEVLGPAWAAFAAIGTGSNGRLAATRPELDGNAIIELADLRDDGPLYPLGWHLSSAAQQKMREQADDLAKTWPPVVGPSVP